MRTLLMLAVGVALAVAFDALAAVLTKRGAARALDGGRLFIWIWLGVMVADFYGGVAAGNTVLLELGVHALLFAVPAGAAWLLWRRRREAPAAPE
jgi:hypothetical protein